MHFDDIEADGLYSVGKRDGRVGIGCSIQDELFASFEQLIQLADKRGLPFDRCLHNQDESTTGH